MQTEDIAAVLDVANETGSDPFVSWRETPWTEVDIENRTTDGPHRKDIVRVARQGHQICGFATLGAFKTDPGYEQTKELSIYVSQAARGKGVGKALMRDVLKSRRGIRRIISSIDASNQNSLRLHEGFQFEHVGVLQGAGWVKGQSRDLVLMMFTAS